MAKPLYKWMDRTDPRVFEKLGPDAGFRHYRSEYRRLAALVIASHDDPRIDRNERDQMRRDRDQAAARVVGFSYGVVSRDVSLRKAYAPTV